MALVTRHISHIPMRWADLDAYQHVNNVVFLRYLQEARVDMLFVHAPQHGAERLVDGIVVAAHEIEYRTPMLLRPEPVRVETWLRSVSASQFELGYEIVDVAEDGSRTVYAVASTRLVPYELEAQRPRRVQPEERAVLERYLDPDSPAVRKVPRSMGAAGKRHSYLCPVRWDDLDAYKHVNNTVFLTFFQEARIDLALATKLSLLDAHEATLVGHQSIEYRKPVPFRIEPLVVDVWVVAIGSASYTIAYEVRDGETLYARGTSSHIAYNLREGRTRRLSDRERELLAAYLEAPE